MPRFYAALALLLLSACSDAKRAAEDPVLRSFDEIVGRPPDFKTPNINMWIVESSPRAGIFYVEPTNLMSLRFQPVSNLKLVVLKGRMKVRVGAQERILETGAYVSIPPSTTYRFSKVGGQRAIYAAILSPDVRNAALILEDPLASSP